MDDALTRDLAAQTEQLLATAFARPGGTPSGGFADGPRPPVSGAPRSTQTLGPLALLSEVTEHAHQLREQVKQLVRAVTGDAPNERPVAIPPRAAGQPAGLLPAMARLTTEIDVAHTDIARMVEQLRRLL